MALPNSWTPEKLKTLMDEFNSGTIFLYEQLELHKKIVANQKEMMKAQDKRTAELEVLVKKRPPSEDETTTVLKEMEDALKKVRENHERRKRRNNRFITDVTAAEPATTATEKPE